MREENLDITKVNIMEDLKNNNSLREYCNINNYDFDIIVKSFSKAFNEFSSLKPNLEKNKFQTPIIELRNLLNLDIPEEDNKKIKLIFLNCFNNNIFYVKEGKLTNLTLSKSLIYEKFLLENLSTFGFYLNEAIIGNNKGIQVVSNITKQDILNVNPFVVKYIDDKGKEFLNYEDIERNISLVTKKFTNIKSTNKENMFNILMSQVKDKPIILNKIGGGYLAGPIQQIIKLKVESIKKLPDLIKYVNETKAVIDEFNYGYVISLNADVVAFYLVKRNCI